MLRTGWLLSPPRRRRAVLFSRKGVAADQADGEKVALRTNSPPGQVTRPPQVRPWGRARRQQESQPGIWIRLPTMNSQWTGAPARSAGWRRVTLLQVFDGDYAGAGPPPQPAPEEAPESHDGEKSADRPTLLSLSNGRRAARRRRHHTRGPLAKRPPALPVYSASPFCPDTMTFHCQPCRRLARTIPSSASASTPARQVSAHLKGRDDAIFGSAPPSPTPPPTWFAASSPRSPISPPAGRKTSWKP